MHTLIYIAAVTLLEFTICIPFIWKRIRKLMAAVVIMGITTSTGLLIGYDFNGWSVLFAFVSIYRVVNLLRLVEGRTPADYLRKVALKTSLILIGAQLLIGASVVIEHQHIYAGHFVLTIIAALECLFSFFLILITHKHLNEIQPPEKINAIPRHEVPTLSVLIPARNETDALKNCLNSIISSTYEKLEIIVLDDCSQDKHTPEIIKEFAHAGVRFIAGTQPPKHWLAKNFAYEQLANEANGEILLFCGADTQFEPHTLQTIVETFVGGSHDMISFLPKNRVPLKVGITSYLVQPLRYAWEITLPRNWLKRPPVLSTCWMISSKQLHKNGLFKSIKNSSSVESYFAKIAASSKVGYRFFQSSSSIGLTSAKSISEQRATALRTRYPQTHRRPEIVLGLSLIEFSVFLLPYVLLVLALAQGLYLIVFLCILAILLQLYLYQKLLKVTYSRTMYQKIWMAPVSILFDIALINYSMWQYEFREVYWKGRNVCIPVMQYGGQEHQSS